MIIEDLLAFNQLLDSTLDQKTLDEDFISLRLAELEGLSKASNVTSTHLIALSYAKLLELTVLLAGTYADNYQILNFGDLMTNPRHIDVCLLNTEFIAKHHGVIDSVPLWFKGQVQEHVGDHYTEDLGRMVVGPSVLSHFVDKGLLLRIVKKERHTRLSDQFQHYVPGGYFAFNAYLEAGKSNTDDSVKELGCGGERGEYLDAAAWLAGSTVLNVVKGSLRTDIMKVLHEIVSADYLKSINKRFEKATDSLSYISIGRKSFLNFPYDDEVPIDYWPEINRNLCHFTLDGYHQIQSELDKSFSNPRYKSPFLNWLSFGSTKTQVATDEIYPVDSQHQLAQLSQPSPRGIG